MFFEVLSQHNCSYSLRIYDDGLTKFVGMINPHCSARFYLVTEPVEGVSNTGKDLHLYFVYGFPLSFLQTSYKTSKNLIELFCKKGFLVLYQKYVLKMTLFLCLTKFVPFLSVKTGIFHQQFFHK